MVLASADADTNLRVIAVKELLSSLSDASLSTIDKVGIIQKKNHIIGLKKTPTISPEIDNFSTYLSYL